MRDQPGDHDLFIHGPNKSVLHFGTAVKSAISVTSGCHRTPGQADRSLTTPRNPE